MVIMVSDPSKDFQGGRLQTWECDGLFKEYGLQQGMCCASGASASLCTNGGFNGWVCHIILRDLYSGDCVVFPSHKFHNVTPVTSGVRNIVAVELWTGDEGVEDIRPGAIGHLIPDMMGS